MKLSPKRVWFLVAPRTGLMNVAGPSEVLAQTNDVLRRIAYEIELYGPCAPTIQTSRGMILGGLKPLPKNPTKFPDIAIVAGAPMDSPPEVDLQLVPWLRRYKTRIPTLVSICTGAFALGKAGLLDGKRATTHWLHLEELRARFPAVEVVDEGIYVKDGSIWTSAGATAGVDLILALVEEEHGRQVAMAVARRLVLFLRRSGNQAQFSSALQRQEKEPPRLRDVSTFVLEHLDEPLPVQRIAHGVGMSSRTLSRWCKEHWSESPAELVRRLRLEEARRLLEETALPLKDIATRTGLGDPSTMWRVFASSLGITPAEYRSRFAAT
jgi:transcriptional regulator GlxA family with amidase domain